MLPFWKFFFGGVRHGVAKQWCVQRRSRLSKEGVVGRLFIRHGSVPSVSSAAFAVSPQCLLHSVETLFGEGVLEREGNPKGRGYFWPFSERVCRVSALCAGALLPHCLLKE